MVNNINMKIQIIHQFIKTEHFAISHEDVFNSVMPKSVFLRNFCDWFMVLFP